MQWAILSFNHKTPLHNFLSILERQVLGGPGWKMPGPHQKVSSSSLLTKQHPFSFSLLFSLQTFPSSLKSTHPNIVLGLNSLEKPKTTSGSLAKMLVYHCSNLMKIQRYGLARKLMFKTRNHAKKSCFWLNIN